MDGPLAEIKHSEYLLHSGSAQLHVTGLDGNCSMCFFCKFVLIYKNIQPSMHVKPLNSSFVQLIDLTFCTFTTDKYGNYGQQKQLVREFYLF